MKRTLCFLSLLVTIPASAEPIERPKSDDEALRKALTDEMARAIKDLRIENEPRPHYIAYTVTDYDFSWLVANFGARTSFNADSGRNLRIEVRVGDRKSDSGNFSDPSVFVREFAMPLVVDDDYAALRRELWLRTDEAYKRAVELLGKKRAAEKSQAKGEEEGAEDFAAVKPASTVYAAEPAKGAIDSKALNETVTKLSAVFREYPEILGSLARGRQDTMRSRMLTSDGTWKDERRSWAEILVSCDTQADDGMPVRSWVAFQGANVAGFPAFADMDKAVRKLATDVTAARKAPVGDSGNAVVLFEGRAAGQLMRRLLGDHLSGTPAARTTRTDGSDRGAEFASKLGQRIGPAFLRVYDDPRQEIGPGKMPIFGSYRADDEGVPAERVELIEKGVLKGLFMSRTPRKELASSNGHGRGRARQGAVRGDIGALYIEGGSAGLAEAALRARALKEAKAAGANTAVYVVRHIDSNIRLGADDDGPQFFSAAPRGGSIVRPLSIVRLRPDGKEEPVRGITFTNLLPRSLKEMVAMGKTPFVYNYLENELPWLGGPPGSVITPSVLFRDVEIRKDTGKQPKPPLYRHPHFAKN